MSWLVGENLTAQVVSHPRFLAEASATWFLKNVDGTSEPTILLATGQTPVWTYQEIVERHNSDGLRFDDATFFALDEYCGLDTEDPRSFRNILWQHVAKPLGLTPDRLVAPNGLATDSHVEAVDYENRLAARGYADIAILGVGTNGHIAFNEPGVPFDMPSHVVTLTEETRIANAGTFGGDPSQVPSQAITVGISTILKSRRILLLARGEAKRRAISELLSGISSPQWPITALLSHPSVHLITDQEAWPEG